MEFPESLRYTATHEWVRVLPEGTLVVGITDFAQDSLGELVYLELPAKGRSVKAGESCAVLESVKAASDVYAPVDGEVIETNAALAEEPAGINKDPYGCWLFRLKPAAAADVSKLLDAKSYSKGLV